MLKNNDIVSVRRALISVSDKTGIVALARFLVDCEVEILSTGGTADLLKREGIAVKDVAAYTGFPEMMDGRIKTLHPKIHGGLLGRVPEDSAVMDEYGIEAIDLLVVNLYPFREVIQRQHVTDDECIENIDIGGPAMIRAGAKNHARVAVVTDSKDYRLIQQTLDEHQGIPSAVRVQLARKAFTHTASYDAAIAEWLADSNREIPDFMPLMLNKNIDLRYGENPHQKAAFYHDCSRTQTGLQQLQGKALSFNNLLDVEAALACVNEFTDPACVIVKHANPCGVACAEDIASAYRRAFAADNVSAFGGIIAVNRTLEADLVDLIISQQFVEVIIAPEVEARGLEILQSKPAIRVMVGHCIGSDFDIRTAMDGFLVQQKDTFQLAGEDIVVKTKRRPDEHEIKDLLFAWQVVKHVKSNAIVLAKQGATAGIGAGQPNRVTSVRIAAAKAHDNGKHADLVMASDAFFPFRDGLDEAYRAGVRAVIHPGGSIHDAEIIAAANEHKMAMVTTNIRHFRH